MSFFASFPTSVQRSGHRSACLGAALLLAAAGCASTTEVTGTGAQSSFIRIVQGVSDATGGVDVYVNGATTLTGFPFGQFVPTGQGQYGSLALGAQLGLAPTGSSTFYSQAPALTANALYTLVAYGRTASGATPAATVAVLTDTLVDTTGRATRPALLRVFNAVDYVRPAGSTGGTPVDVYIYAQGSARPSTPTVAGLAYGAGSRYTTGAVGTLQADVFAAGAARTGTPLFTASFSTAAASVRTLVLLDPPATAGASASGSVLVLNDFL